MSHYGKLSTMLEESSKNVSAIANVVAVKSKAFDMLASQQTQIEQLTRENRQLNMLIKQACEALQCDPDKLTETALRLLQNEKPA